VIEYFVASAMRSRSSRLHDSARRLIQRHLQFSRGVIVIGSSDALRSIRPSGTTGRSNSISTWLAGGTSSPAGVIRRMPSDATPSNGSALTGTADRNNTISESVASKATTQAALTARTMVPVLKCSRRPISGRSATGWRNESRSKDRLSQCHGRRST
jgi:hypothetical protein